MTAAQTPRSMSTGLLKVAERAKREPEAQFNSLAHLVDEAALAQAYGRLRKDAAVGVDGIDKEQYGQGLEGKLRALHGRMKAGWYRHQPIRRVHIPKDNGKTRPIGIASTEDKIVQGAISEVLGTIYEQDFLSCSYGFRPGRSAHDAVRALNEAVGQGKVNWILEADIESFFDSLDRSKLAEMLRIRVADGAMLKLVGKCLHVGVLDGAEFSTPDEGTTQGSSLSPLLGNIYLHYVMDQWFEHEVRPRMHGRVLLCRYADDLVIGFERRDDAERVMQVLPARMGKFNLKLHPGKTRLLPFGRPHHGAQKGPATFDFLGFTWYWRRSRRGRWVPACKSRRARLSRAIRVVYDWCRSHRHQPVAAQHAALTRRIRGHFNYFGVNGNTRSLSSLYYHAKRAWYKWLRRRSQRTRLNWERFEDLFHDFPFPLPTVYVQIWGK